MSTVAKKAAPAHPAYVVMVAAAIKALKERSGSSARAIAKYIGATYKVPAGFEKTLSTQLKNLAAAGKLIRVKASFKLSEALKKPVVAKKPKVVKKAVKKVVKKKVAAKKPAAKKTGVTKTTTTKKAATKKPAAKKPAAKKPAAKKPAAKKPAAKKPAAAKKA